MFSTLISRTLENIEALQHGCLSLSLPYREIERGEGGGISLYSFFSNQFQKHQSSCIQLLCFKMNSPFRFGLLFTLFYIFSFLLLFCVESRVTDVCI